MNNTLLFADSERMQYCRRSFLQLFSEFTTAPRKHALTSDEVAEVLEISNALAQLFNVCVPQERWLVYMDMACWLTSARHLKLREVFKGICAINNLTFFWDDLHDEFLPHESLVLEEAYKVCERYFPRQVVDSTYFYIQQWLEFDSFTRNSPLRELLCQASLESYWEFKLIDSGVPYWLGITAPVYDDPGMVRIIRTGLPAQLLLRPIMVVNDVYSYDKEKQLGEVSNFLYHANVAEEREFRALFEHHLQQMRRDIMAMKWLGERLNNILLDLIYGHFLWSDSTYRYKQVNRLNRLLARTTR